MFKLRSGDSGKTPAVISLAASMHNLNRQFHICVFLCIYVFMVFMYVVYIYIYIYIIYIQCALGNVTVHHVPQCMIWHEAIGELIITRWAQGLSF